MISNVFRYSTSLEVEVMLKLTEALLAAIGKSGVQRTAKHQYQQHKEHNSSCTANNTHSPFSIFLTDNYQIKIYLNFPFSSTTKNNPSAFAGKI